MNLLFRIYSILYRYIPSVDKNKILATNQSVEPNVRYNILFGLILTTLSRLVWLVARQGYAIESELQVVYYNACTTYRRHCVFCQNCSKNEITDWTIFGFFLKFSRRKFIYRSEILNIENRIILEK